MLPIHEPHPLNKNETRIQATPPLHKIQSGSYKVCARVTGRWGPPPQGRETEVCLSLSIKGNSTTSKVASLHQAVLDANLHRW